MSNYALISYYSTNFSHSENGTVNEVYRHKSIKFMTSFLDIELSDQKEVSSVINDSSMNKFFPGMAVKVDIYKNLFGDFFYVESSNGKLKHFGPLVAYILDILFLGFIFLATSSNIIHRKRVGENNVEKIDKEFKNMLFISILISATLSIIILFLFT